MVPHTRAALRVDRLRALNVPTPVEVVVDADGIPVEVRPATGMCTTDNVSCIDGRATTSTSSTTARLLDRPTIPPPTGQVTDILETWRIDDEWWRTPITRRYIDVVLEGGTHVVLFEDLHSRAWFIQQP